MSECQEILVGVPSIPQHVSLNSAMPQSTRKFNDIIGLFTVETHDERSRMDFPQDRRIVFVSGEDSVSLMTDFQVQLHILWKGTHLSPRITV